MIGPMRTYKVALAMAGAAVLLAMAASVPVSNATLGNEWNCSKTAFVLTTCRQASNDDVTRKTEDAKSPPA
jgi:hypothetical protein